MKIISNFKKEFTPIEFNIKLESEEDVALLWAYFNASRNSIKENSSTGKIKELVMQSLNDNRTVTLFNVIDKIARGICIID